MSISFVSVLFRASSVGWHSCIFAMLLEFRRYKIFIATKYWFLLKSPARQKHIPKTSFGTPLWCGMLGEMIGSRSAMNALDQVNSLSHLACRHQHLVRQRRLPNLRNPFKITVTTGMARRSRQPWRRQPTPWLPYFPPAMVLPAGIYENRLFSFFIDRD